jgi:MSHA biogenesis protein MshL
MPGFLKKKNCSVARILGSLAILALLAGCDLARNYTHMDRSGNMDVQDYRDALASHIPAQEAADAKHVAKIPSLAPYVAQPSDDLKSMPLISVSVNQTVPLRDLLFEMARQAHYGIELDPRIRGAIIFAAEDTPFDEVMQQISEIAGLSYEFHGKIMRVQLDKPIHATYKIDYLSYIRTNSSSIQNNVTLASGGATGSGSNAGSQFQAAGQSEANFWGELETNLNQILNAPYDEREMKTEDEPVMTVSAPNPPPVVPVVTIDQNGKTVQAAPPQATLQVSSLPPAAPGAAVATSVKSTSPFFSINKQAGLISVYATQRQQKQVADYLKQVERSATAQVLIEAKVMEVDLTDEFSSGVNWGQVAKLLNGRFSLNTGAFTAPGLAPAAVGNLSIGNIKADAGTENEIISAVSRFGTVKSLASPRLTVLNNQSAILSVANNQVYFQLTVNVTAASANGAAQTTINSTAHNVPEGVLINVQPSINLDRRTISLSVRPTVTRVVGQVADPAVAFLNIKGVVSNVPVVNVQEMDSVVNMNSGETILMGGMMQDSTQAQQTGVPVLSEVPVLGTAFRSHGDKISKTELLILLCASIVDGRNGTVDETDEDLYKKFSDDRHPLKF